MAAFRSFKVWFGSDSKKKFGFGSDLVTHHKSVLDFDLVLIWILIIKLFVYDSKIHNLDHKLESLKQFAITKV